MPRRRITTAKQKAASARNLVAARKRLHGTKVGNTGKNVLLHHVTTPEAAKGIVAQGFKPISRSYFTQPRDHVFASRSKQLANFEEYGSAVVSFKINRKHVSVDTTTQYDTQQGALKVPLSALKGVKVRRTK